MDNYLKFILFLFFSLNPKYRRQERFGISIERYEFRDDFVKKFKLKDDPIIVMIHSMGKRKLASLAASIFPIFVVLSFLVGSLSIIETAQAQRQNEYAIYLSPGFEEGAHWGGYHVTITGFSNEHALGKSEKEEAKKAWNEANGGKEYSFANKKR